MEFNRSGGGEEYKAILNALDQNVLVSITDVKGDITYANHKFAEISKYSIDELIGQNHRILKSGRQPNEMFVDLWKTISNGKVWRGEINNKAKDGSFYWVDANIAPIFTEDNKISGYIAIRFIITDRKKLEEEALEKIHNIEIMNTNMIGRELKMVELKERIKELEEKLKNRCQSPLIDGQNHLS